MHIFISECFNIFTERVTEMTIMWSTFYPTGSTIVEYGQSADDLDKSANGTWQILNNRGSIQYVHTVKLSDLAVATKYCKYSLHLFEINC